MTAGGPPSVPNPILELDANNIASYPGTGSEIYNLYPDNPPSMRDTWTMYYNYNYGNLYTVLDGVKCFDATVPPNSIGTGFFGLPSPRCTIISWTKIQHAGDISMLNDNIMTAGAENLGIKNTSFTTYNVFSHINVWTQWALVCDDTTSTNSFYVNDSFVGNATPYQTVAGQSGGIWTYTIDAPGASKSFGYLANLMFYDQALSQPQIASIFNSRRSVFGV